MSRLLLSGLALALTLGCHRRGADPALPATGGSPVPVTPAPVAGRPRIDALEPDSMRFVPNALRTLTIRGAGFVAAGGAAPVVQVGPIVLRDVPANAAGTAIAVTLPERHAPPGGGAPRPLVPGVYDVTVTVGALTSNTVTLRVLP